MIKVNSKTEKLQEKSIEDLIESRKKLIERIEKLNAELIILDNLIDGKLTRINRVDDWGF